MTVTQPMAPADSTTPATATRTAKPFLLRIPWYAWARRTQYRLMDHVVGTYRRVERLDDQWPDLPRYAHQPLGLYVLPIWFGFILVLDGVNVARSGSSPLTRNWRGFVLLFLLSIPFWWVFELLNIPVQNWRYFFDHPIDTNTLHGWIEYHTISSICFSTVLPAVLEIAESGQLRRSTPTPRAP